MIDEGFIAETPEKIIELSSRFRESRILLTGIELGVFTVLDGKRLTSDDVAGRIQCDPRATDRLMNSLVSMGFLSKKSGVFSNVPHSEKFLSKNSPSYLASLHHTSQLWESWSTLTECVRRGTSVIDKSVLTPDQTEAFIGAMHQFAKLRAPELIELMGFEGSEKVMDLGGGSGAFVIELAKQHVNLDIHLFDLPQVTDIAIRHMKTDNVDDRITIHKGNMLKDDLGYGYDMVFLSHIIHQFSIEEIQVLFAKVYLSLNAGGRIVILDFLVDEERTSPPWNVFFALNMLVNTEAGDTFTEVEIKRFMTDAGFSDVYRKNPSDRGNLIFGVKS